VTLLSDAERVRIATEIGWQGPGAAQVFVHGALKHHRVRGLFVAATKIQTISGQPELTKTGGA
jgi:hypothetical protein